MNVPLADLEVSQVGDVVVAGVAGEIDMSNATDLGDAIGRELSNDALGLVLDLVEVSYLDSAGIRIVYELRDRLHARGQELRLAVADDSPIADALRVSDVTGAIATFPTLAAALEGFGA